MAAIASLTPARAPLALATRRVASVLAFALVPGILLAGFLVAGAANDPAFDFRQFWQGGRDVLDGASPYPAAESLPSAEQGRGLTPQEIQDVFRFPYPAPAAVALLPFATLPFAIASWMVIALLVAAVPLTLRIVGVSDWRCYGVAFAWIATLGAIRLGTLTPLLALGLAVAWRYRDRRLVVAGSVAGVIVLKLFLWPLLVWLVATRRVGAASAAAGAAAAATVAAWAAIGFDGMLDYPALLGRLAESVQDAGYSVVALGTSLGAPGGVSRAVAVAAAIAVVAATATRAQHEGRDLAVFAASLAAALLLSPIVWLHYLYVLIVPIAVARPRLTGLWLLPLLLWASPFQESGGDTWRIALAFAVAAGALGAVALGRGAGQAAPASAGVAAHGGA